MVADFSANYFKLCFASLTPRLREDDNKDGVILSTAPKIEYVCSFCGKRKGDAKDWLLGFEGTKVKSVVMKYTITLLGKWDDERADEPNAVHFCCTTCQNNYLCKNYGDDTWAA